MPEFYKSSNKLPISALVAIPVAFAVVSSVLGVIYAMGIWYCPIIYVNALICFAWAGLTAALAGRAIKATNGRFPFAVGLLALVGALVGYYVHWCVWLTFVIKSIDVGSRSLSGLKISLDPEAFLNFFLNPADSRDFVVAIHERGLWALGKGKTLVNGTFLTVVWGIEILIYAITTLVYACSTAGEPFSEAGNRWFDKTLFKNNEFKAPDDPEENRAVARNIMNGDLGYFLEAPLVTDKSENAFSLEIFSLPSSPVAYATVKGAVQGKKKSETRQYADLVTKMAVSGDLADRIVQRTR
ncbi:MAG: hypothetical protein LBF41_05600 [Deltaproteobacteria bacterium]|jgi:hypothetical protein|nr:hypothetical protein [Deltaproteobacteria bacterium]